MFSRVILIILAFSVGLYRISQGAYLAAAGLFALGAGLLVLRAAETRPAIKPLAWACFAVTAVTIAIIIVQQRY